MRSFGVEEEFLLVDARTGNHAPVAENLLPGAGPGRDVQAPRRSKDGIGRRNAPAPKNNLTTEVQREQIEAVSAPFTGLEQLAAAIRTGRTEAHRQAATLGHGQRPWEPRRCLDCPTRSGSRATPRWKNASG